MQSVCPACAATCKGVRSCSSMRRSTSTLCFKRTCRREALCVLMKYDVECIRYARALDDGMDIATLTRMCALLSQTCLLKQVMHKPHLKNIRVAFESSQVGSSVAPAVDKNCISPSLQTSLNHGGVAILGRYDERSAAGIGKCSFTRLVYLRAFAQGFSQGLDIALRSCDEQGHLHDTVA